MEIRSNSVRSSTFLSTEWEFLHAVFTTMRYCYYKNRKRERLGSQKRFKVWSNELLIKCLIRPKTVKIARFRLSCGFYASQTFDKSYFRYPRDVTHSRNHYTAVPEAFTPSLSGVFRVFFTLFPDFRTFFTGNSNFST